MFHCHEFETRLLAEGKMHGVVRKYDMDVGCPYVQGDEVLIVSEHLRDQDGKAVPLAKATIVSVRPGTVGEFRSDPMIASVDGYDNPESWYTYYTNFIEQGIREDEPVFHLKFRVEDIENEAF